MRKLHGMTPAEAMKRLFDLDESNRYHFAEISKAQTEASKLREMMACADLPDDSEIVEGGPSYAPVFYAIDRDPDDPSPSGVSVRRVKVVAARGLTWDAAKVAEAGLTLDPDPEPTTPDVVDVKTHRHVAVPVPAEAHRSNVFAPDDDDVIDNEPL